MARKATVTVVLGDFRLPENYIVNNLMVIKMAIVIFIPPNNRLSMVCDNLVFAQEPNGTNRAVQIDSTIKPGT